MPNVTRGDRMAGLVSYLAGPGRTNEHEEPHLVAGDAALMAWHDDAELGHDAALSIARHLDKPRVAFGVDVPGGHVWHCSLSLRAGDKELTDGQWSDIANDFMTAMEFDNVEDSKAPTRWVAMRHGLSKNGNDHIHIAVNLVREDGTKASTHNDFQRAQTAARALEVKYGLEQLESTKGERATRGYSPAEQSQVQAQSERIAKRKYAEHMMRVGGEQPAWGQLDPREQHARITAEVRLNAPRNDLARSVRAAAGASENEAEFVRRLRRSGVLVRPRFADGRADVITGYSVAIRPTNGERPIWYGGGQMGRDLTLPRLREGWPDTPAGATDAAAEWQAAKRGRRPVAPGREMREPDPELWQRHTEEIGQLREQLRAIPVDDRDTWSTVARQTAAAFAAWSNAVEETPGDLAEASDALAKSAQTYRRPVKPQRAGRVAMSGATMLLASVARGGQGTAAQLAMLRQLMNLSQAVYDAAKAAGEVRQAANVEAAVRERVMNVRRQLEAVPATAGATSTATVTATIVDRSAIVDASVQEALDKMQRAEEQRSKTTGSPVPPQVEPARPAHHDEAGRRSRPGAMRRESDHGR